MPAPRTRTYGPLIALLLATMAWTGPAQARTTAKLTGPKGNKTLEVRTGLDNESGMADIFDEENGYLYVQDAWSSISTPTDNACSKVNYEGDPTIRCPIGNVTKIDVAGGAQENFISVEAEIPSILRGGPESDLIEGGSGNDTIFGGDRRDIIEDDLGNDTVHGEGGNDIFDTSFESDGADTYIGGPGEDQINYNEREASLSLTIGDGANDGEPGEGDDIRGDVENVSGGSGRDLIVGNSAANNLFGGKGIDTIDGGAGSDNISGSWEDEIGTDSDPDVLSYASRTENLEIRSMSAGFNSGGPTDGPIGARDHIAASIEIILGGSGNDVFTAHPGVSMWLIGGDGNDVFRDPHARQGPDAFTGGTGSDTVDYSERDEPVEVFLDSGNHSPDSDNDNLGEIENAIGTKHADFIYGNSADNIFVGGGNVENGPEAIFGEEGNDTLMASFLVATNGPVTIYGGPGADKIAGGNGNDFIDTADHWNEDLIACGGGFDDLRLDDAPYDPNPPADCEKQQRVNFGSSWGKWKSLGKINGANAAGRPGAVSWGPNRIDLFPRRADGQIFHRWSQNGLWYGTTQDSGAISSPFGVAASSTGVNKLDVFAVAPGAQNMRVTSWNGTAWNNWGTSLTGAMTTGPSAESWGSNRTDLVARGTDNAVWHRYREGASWTPWASLGGVATFDPAITSMRPNHLALFTRSHLNLVQWKQCNTAPCAPSNWSAWQQVPGQNGVEISSPVSAVSPENGRIYLFARGPAPKYELLLKEYTEQTNEWWPANGWRSLGGSLSSGPQAASWGPGHIDVFAVGLNGEIYTISLS